MRNLTQVSISGGRVMMTAVELSSDVSHLGIARLAHSNNRDLDTNLLEERLKVHKASLAMMRVDQLQGLSERRHSVKVLHFKVQIAWPEMANRVDLLLKRLVSAGSKWSTWLANENATHFEGFMGSKFQ
jgi:hypothetical protein